MKVCMIFQIIGTRAIWRGEGEALLIDMKTLFVNNMSPKVLKNGKFYTTVVVSFHVCDLLLFVKKNFFWVIFAIFFNIPKSHNLYLSNSISSTVRTNCSLKNIFITRSSIFHLIFIRW